MNKTQYLQIKKPWRIFGSIEDFRLFTGRRTAETYHEYYLKRILKQQFNVNSKYAKQAYYMYLKKVLRSFFRYELQLQPYHVNLYPYYQTLKGVYLRDTIFHSKQLNLLGFDGYTIIRRNFGPKVLNSVDSDKYGLMLYGGLNYFFKPARYKYSLLPNLENLTEIFNDNFKHAAYMRNIV